MPKISIVLPVYNAEKYLHECVGSVVKQTFLDWELIAVDDGSTDTSGSILDQYAKQDERIRVIHKKNGRVWAARNDALDVAQGEWITFLDSDDCYAPYWLAEAMRMAKGGVNVIHQQLYVGSHVPKGFYDEPNNNEQQVYEGRDAAVWAWRTLPRKGFPVLCFIRRSIIQGHRFKPVIDCKEDSVWLLGLSPRIDSVCETGYCGYFYRMTPNSISRRKKRTEQCLAYLEALHELWETQREWRKNFELDRLVSEELRYCADYDVIEWMSGLNNLSAVERTNVRRAYSALVHSSGFFDKWQGEKRYVVVFWLWRKVGWTWPVRGVSNLFILARKILNAIKV